jgi:hypothetical protein
MELNRAKSTSFNDIIEKIQSRVSGWKSKTLSQAARTTLISSVATSIPSYTMSFFQLPKKICNSIDSLFRNFWWGSQPDKKPLCLKSWKSICLPKSSGGLGFRRSFDSNKALIAKLGWSLVANEDKHWVRILKSKYLNGSLFMAASTPSSCSWLWKGILNTRDLLKIGTCTIIGNGEHTSVWEDPWIPTLENFIPSPSLTNPNPTNIYRVSDLISPTTHQWDREKIFTIFDPITAGKILNIHLPNSLTIDRPCWTLCSTSILSVKSAYLTDQHSRFDSTGAFSQSEWKSLWKSKINARHNHPHPPQILPLHLHPPPTS